MPSHLRGVKGDYSESKATPTKSKIKRRNILRLATATIKAMQPNRTNKSAIRPLLGHAIWRMSNPKRCPIKRPNTDAILVIVDGRINYFSTSGGQNGDSFIF